MLKRIVSAAVAAVIISTAVYASGPAPDKDQAKFEVNFLTMMIDHHYAAVKMSELCDGRVIHPELKALCDHIRTSQTAEIRQMQAWLRDWYGVTHEPELSGKARKQIEELSRTTGAAFEIAYMTMMIEHHADAIVEGAECLQRAYHADMINMCAKMVADQGDEIAQMRIWLCQWYQICNLNDAKKAK